MKTKKQDWLVTINKVVRYRQNNNEYVPEYKQIKIRDVDISTIESYLSGENVTVITDDCGVSYATRCFISAEPCSSNKRMNDEQQVEADTEHHSLGFLDLDENGEVIFKKMK